MQPISHHFTDFHLWLTLVWQPPVTFQPPPAPSAASASGSAASATRQPNKPKQPDLITRYNLKDKLDMVEQAEEESKKGKAWSSSRDERQASLQRRRDEMILMARKKMEAKMAAEKKTHMS